MFKRVGRRQVGGRTHGGAWGHRAQASGQIWPPFTPRFGSEAKAHRLADSGAAAKSGWSLSASAARITGATNSGPMQSGYLKYLV